MKFIYSSGWYVNLDRVNYAISMDDCDDPEHRSIRLFFGLDDSAVIREKDFTNGIAGKNKEPAPEQSEPPTPPTTQPGAMEISDDGMGLIKQFEGFRSAPYRDSAGVATIGYGTTRYPSGKRVAMSDPRISEDYAAQLMRHDLSRFEQAVNDAVMVPLTQNQFDALVSFTYNVGSGALRKSTLLKKLNAGDYAGASDQFPRWNKATVNGKKVALKGLTRRRKQERELFIS